MDEIQNIINEFIKKYNLECSNEIRFIDLTSEIGELGKEILIGNNYGRKEFSNTDNIESEIGDVLFSLICLANGMNISLEKALSNVLKKYENRFLKNGNIGSDR